MRYFSLIFIILIFDNYNELEKFWIKHFLTKKELKEFKKLKTEKEIENFILDFWKKRDPTPKTEENEFKERCELIAKYADKEFSIKGKRGSETDRGKVLLLLGYPSLRQQKDFSFFKEKEQSFKIDNFDYEIEEVIHSLEGAPMEYENIIIEVWVYEQEKLPFDIGGKNLFIFFKKEKGERDFYLYFKSKKVLDILERAKRQYIINENN